MKNHIHVAGSPRPPPYDMTVRIWDAASGAELAVLEGHQNGVTSMAWHPDGESLASASLDDTVHNRHGTVPCARILTNFTAGEWITNMGFMTIYQATCLGVPSAPVESVPIIKGPFLTNGRWAAVIGIVLAVVSILVALVWLAYRLGRAFFRRISA